MSDAATAASTSDGSFATALRGFGPVGIAAIVIIVLGNLIIVPVSAILVLVWAALSRTPFSALGFVRPRSWLGTLVVGIVLGVAFKIVMKALVMPLLGAPDVNAAYHYLAGNKAVILPTLYALVVGAGFGEEVLFRGFLFERLQTLAGPSALAKIVILPLSAVLFGLAHYANQGLPGVEQATIMGLVYGTMFAATGSLAMSMISHAAFDLAAYAMIYWNLETFFAHLFYR